MKNNNVKLADAVKKELRQVEKQEKRLESSSLKTGADNSFKAKLESKVPKKVYAGLESAFCKCFSVVLNQGSVVIEKSCNVENAKEDFAVKDYAVMVKGGRRELRNVKKGASQANVLNTIITTTEGIALGALGIGMPDIIIFVGTVLRGVYETAINYGFEHDTMRERYLMLKMMEASLSTGEEWRKLNNDVDNLLKADNTLITDEQFKAQINKTASVFAMDMLLLKFIQGLPVVGVIGGVANPVYYNKILKYVQLKYRKRYLMNKSAFK